MRKGEQHMAESSASHDGATGGSLGGAAPADLDRGYCKHEPHDMDRGGMPMPMDMGESHRGFLSRPGGWER